MAPEGASQQTAQGAALMMQFFLEEYAAALKIPDSTAIEALSLPSCEFCADLLSDFDRLEIAEGHLESGAIEVDATSISAAADTDTDNVVIVKMNVQQTAFEYVDAAGMSLGGSAPGEFAISARMRLDDSIWRVEGVVVDDL